MAGVTGFEDFESDDLDGPQVHDDEPITPVVAGKPTVEVRGFFIEGGHGIYEGATRDEPRDNYFVDLKDYETGEIKRVWGVALSDVMAQAKAAYGLVPGSRIHLVQRDKSSIFVKGQDGSVRETYANNWTCKLDAGPQPAKPAAPASTQRDSFQEESARRQKEAANADAALARRVVAPVEGSRAVHRDRPIDVTGLTSEQYKELLEERLKLAESSQEASRMMAQEAEARKAGAAGAKAQFAPLEALWEKIAHERDVDILAHLISQGVGALVHSLRRAMPTVQTTFESLGGLNAWKRRGCEDKLDELQEAIAAAKASPTYQAFEKDERVLQACESGETPGELIARRPDLVKTDVIGEHLAKQELSAGAAAAAAPRPLHNGLWASVMQSAHKFADRFQEMRPDNLFKPNGGIDQEWIDSMRTKVTGMAKGLKETLMPEAVRQQMEELIASVLKTLKALFEAAHALLTSRGRDAAPSANASAGMER